MFSSFRCNVRTNMEVNINLLKQRSLLMGHFPGIISSHQHKTPFVGKIHPMKKWKTRSVFPLDFPRTLSIGRKYIFYFLMRFSQNRFGRDQGKWSNEKLSSNLDSGWPSTIHGRPIHIRNSNLTHTFSSMSRRRDPRSLETGQVGEPSDQGLNVTVAYLTMYRLLLYLFTCIQPRVWCTYRHIQREREREREFVDVIDVEHPRRQRSLVNPLSTCPRIMKAFGQGCLTTKMFSQISCYKCQM